MLSLPQQDRQKALFIVLVVALQISLWHEVLIWAPLMPSSRPRKPLISFCFCLFISSVRSASKASRSCSTSDRSCSAMSCLFHLWAGRSPLLIPKYELERPFLNYLFKKVCDPNSPCLPMISSCPFSSPNFCNIFVPVLSKSSLNAG